MATASRHRRAVKRGRAKAVPANVAAPAMANPRRRAAMMSVVRALALVQVVPVPVLAVREILALVLVVRGLVLPAKVGRRAVPAGLVVPA